MSRDKLLLLLSVLLPIWGMLDQAATAQPLNLDLGPTKFWNLLLSGLVLILALKRSEAGLVPRRD